MNTNCLKSVVVITLLCVIGCDSSPKRTEMDRKAAEALLAEVRPLNSNSLPVKDRTWRRKKYESVNRSRVSGKRSDNWVYESSAGWFAWVSLDQAFEGWHDLALAYRKNGWSVSHWKWIDDVNLAGSSEEWPYIKVEFEKPTGEKGLLLFSMFDDAGNPIDPPRRFDFPSRYMEHPWKRIDSKILKEIRKTKACQAQIFLQGYGTISFKMRTELTAHYLDLREVMRKAYLDAEPVAATSLKLSEQTSESPPDK